MEHGHRWWEARHWHRRRLFVHARITGLTLEVSPACYFSQLLAEILAHCNGVGWQSESTRFVYGTADGVCNKALQVQRVACGELRQASDRRAVRQSAV